MEDSKRCASWLLWNASSFVKKSCATAEAVLGVDTGSITEDASEALVDDLEGLDLALRVTESARLLDCG